jgi:site-specific DNA-methyltransferase (adenine-specific)
MKTVTIGKATIHNCDCMELLKATPDKFYDLAVIDPPYGIARFGNRYELSNRLCKEAKLNKWDVKPETEYFTELFRGSKKSIIWGANNFILPESEYFIVWDKQQSVANFASAEYAWTNIKMPAKVFRHSIHQVMATRKEDGGKIHPTQKPVALYEWLLTNYAKQGDKILDTHLGSGSHAIACNNLGFELTACELDTDYFEASIKRIEQASKQATLFEPKQVVKQEQGSFL